MYARLAMFRGVDAAQIDAVIDGMSGAVQADFNAPPEGLEGVREVMLLVDREHGRGLGITLYETEEDMLLGDAVLSRRSPSQAGGVRTGVEQYEVALRRVRG